MKSVPWAIGWEMLHRGRWGLILAALGANALPVLLFGLLKYDGALENRDEPSTILMHTVTVQINLFLFATAVIAALSPTSRLYTFPISTASLVGWHMVLGMIAVAVEMAATIAILNMCFGLGWRPLGPTLFAGAMFAAMLASLWLAEKSGWLPVAFGAAMIPMCLWFKARYGPLFSTPNHYWTEVTFGDAATLAVVPIGAYVVGVFGVTRNRCGSPPYSIGLMAWLQRVFAFGPQTELAFRNPLRAQLWFEWRTKGAAMPGIVGMGLFMGFGIWLLSSRNANAALRRMYRRRCDVADCRVAGRVRPRQRRSRRRRHPDRPIPGDPPAHQYTTGQHDLEDNRQERLSRLAALGRRPVDRLRDAAGAASQPARVTLPAPLGWWCVPVALVGDWTAAGLMLTLVLTGRQNLLGGVIFAAITLAIGLMLFQKTVLSPQAGEYFSRGLAAFGGLVFVLTTTVALVAANRRQLISRRMLSAAVAAWIVLCSLGALFWPPLAVERFALYALIAGLLALSVAPLATAPLAIAWNRTR